MTISSDKGSLNSDENRSRSERRAQKNTVVLFICRVAANAIHQLRTSNGFTMLLEKYKNTLPRITTAYIASIVPIPLLRGESCYESAECGRRNFSRYLQEDPRKTFRGFTSVQANI